MINGKIIDAQTKEPLAFVSIIYYYNLAVTSDIDGKFFIKTDKSIEQIRVNYLGYKPLIYKINKNENNITIELESSNIELPEVEILPGVNPALRIINGAIENKTLNNPEQLENFLYTSYSKMIFSVLRDSLLKQKNMKEQAKVDSILDKMYLFISESVAQHQFLKPDKHNEKVIATKMSGFKEPLFVLLASQYQSFSFYNDYIKIGEKLYLNPISRGSLNKYAYILQDTIYNNTDTVYIISFFPKKGKNIDGLNGVLYINTNKYAIQNVIAQPDKESNLMNFKIQQQYELIDDKYWFPVQLNTDIYFKIASVSGKVRILAQGKTYLREIKINQAEKEIKRVSNSFEVLPSATDKDENFWQSNRTDSITDKEKETYLIIDSIGKKEHFDRLAKSMLSLFSGKIPFKFLDLELSRFVKYSRYEGLMLGLGFETNSKISKNFSTGGYYSYSIKREIGVYGANLKYKNWGKSDMTINLSYINDFEETGASSFFDDNSFVLDKESYWNFLISQKDRIIKRQIDLSLRPFKDMKLFLGFSDSYKEITNNYNFGYGEENVVVKLKNYYLTELTAGLKYSFNEKYIITPLYKKSLGTNYPILWLQYIKGFDNVLNGYFSYNRYDVKLSKSFIIRNTGTTSVILMGGYIDSSVPLPELYHQRGGYYKFTLYAPNSFSTMRFGEFFADKYVNIFLNHNFGKLLFKTKKFKPEFEILNNISIGTMKKSETHYNYAFSSPAKGYYESGVLINNLINQNLYSLGLGFFYRYGCYRYKSNLDNIALKFTFNFVL
ncbi:MAG: carboxypeptidase-like regulatory domain-containing protein [Bacteroidales bacterium]|nr:carboxypeptidase-like regulatory domain-containing protein [Bacteroidales bacterium]